MKLRHLQEFTKRNRFLIYGVLLVLYVGLRALLWSRTFLLEDHDSVAYLFEVHKFLTLQLDKILAFDPDSTPLYPFLATGVALLGFEVEAAARLVSLLSSIFLFFAVLFIGRQLSDDLSVALSLLLLTLSPALALLSIAVLTESTYIAVVYGALWLFLRQYRQPRMRDALLLGLVSGLAFLTRTEGVILLAYFPFLLLVYFLWDDRPTWNWKRIGSWTFLFIFGFSLLAVPQIVRVSRDLGQLALNGRQVWMQVFKTADGKSNREKIYGLDYSPAQTNLPYLQQHPEARERLESPGLAASLAEITGDVLRESHLFYRERLGSLVGPFGFLFFALGLAAWLRRERFYELFLILSFLGLNLVAPLLHNVVLRHVAVLAPAMLFVAGIGIVELVRYFRGLFRHTSVAAGLVTLLIAMHVVGMTVYPVLHSVAKPAKENREYELASITRFVREIHTFGLDRPIICARKSYLAFLAEGESVRLPYTDYEGLVRYCRLNEVDFLFLQYDLIRFFPFLAHFSSDRPSPEFELILEATRSGGGRLELYRFRASP